MHNSVHMHAHILQQAILQYHGYNVYTYPLQFSNFKVLLYMLPSYWQFMVAVELVIDTYLEFCSQQKLKS